MDRFLFNQYIDWNMTEQFDLFIECDYNHERIKEWLCDKSVKQTPLHLAAGQYSIGRHSPLVKLLTFSKPFLRREKILYIRDYRGRTPMDIALSLRTHKPKYYTQDSRKNWKKLNKMVYVNILAIKNASKW